MRIYADSDSLPGELLQEDYVEGSCGEEELILWEKYRYEAPVSFRAEAGQRYWFSVQAELWNLPQWGRLGSTAKIGCNSAFRSEYFGFPDWTDVAVLGSGDWDASQEFICYSAVEIQHPILDSTDREDFPCIVDAVITALEYPLDPDQAWIEYRTSRPGLWTRVAMQDFGGGHWQATIPGQQQPKEVQYYIHAGDIAGNVGTDPPGGRETPHGFDVAWLVQPFEEAGHGVFIVDPDGDDDASGGAWEYADMDTGYVYPYEPREDHTTLGSKCWITARGYGHVVEGKTSIQSPLYDLTGATIAKGKYWRWYSGNIHSSTDTLLVQVRNDGGPWMDIENTSESTQRWEYVECDLYGMFGDEIGGIEFRFTVTSQSDNQIVEVALDDFLILADLESIVSIEDRVDTPPAFCRVSPNPFRSEATIQFRTPVSGPIRLTIHDVAGRLVATLIDGINLEAGEHNTTWDGTSDRDHRLQSGIYYVRLNTDTFGAERHLVLFN